MLSVPGCSARFALYYFRLTWAFEQIKWRQCGWRRWWWWSVIKKKEDGRQRRLNLWLECGKSSLWPSNNKSWRISLLIENACAPGNLTFELLNDTCTRAVPVWWESDNDRQTPGRPAAVWSWLIQALELTVVYDPLNSWPVIRLT